jgi:Ca2+-binding EF-hand superfamily protein
MFKFPIHDQYDVNLVLGEKDVNLVQHLAFDLGLYNMSLQTMARMVLEFSEEGLMSYSGFTMFFAQLGSNPADDDKLARIFKCFDRTDTGCCDCMELIIGLSILCQGK